MSDHLPKNRPQEEEVDLGQLFNAIGKLFEKFANFISGLLKRLFRALIYGLKPLVNNFKVVCIMLMSFAIVGLILQLSMDKVYYSEMLVRPYYESKYQLVNNVNKLNSLLTEKKYDELSQIFEINYESAENLIDFDIDIGPQTQNELLLDYNDFLKTLDSSLNVEVSFKEFVENRDIFGGSVYVIKARSKDQDVFRELESGIIKTFRNEYSIKNKKIKDSSLTLQRRKLQRDLKIIDSIQNIYLGVLINESKKNTATMSSGLIPLTQERTITKEYELLEEKIRIRNELQNLDEQQIVESEFYDIISSFELGREEEKIEKMYAIILPTTGFILMVIIFAAYKSFNYIKYYE